MVTTPDLESAIFREPWFIAEMVFSNQCVCSLLLGPFIGESYYMSYVSIFYSILNIHIKYIYTSIHL